MGLVQLEHVGDAVLKKHIAPGRLIGANADELAVAALDARPDSAMDSRVGEIAAGHHDIRESRAPHLGIRHTQCVRLRAADLEMRERLRGHVTVSDSHGLDQSLVR